MEDMKQRFARRLCFRICYVHHQQPNVSFEGGVLNTSARCEHDGPALPKKNNMWKHKSSFGMKKILSITLSNLFCDEISNPFAVDVI